MGTIRRQNKKNNKRQSMDYKSYVEINESSFVNPGVYKPSEHTQKLEPNRKNTKSPKWSQKSKLRKVRNFIIILFIVAILGSAIFGFVYLFNSDIFKIENVVYNGVSHLTEDECSALANINTNENLLNVDEGTIISRLKKDAWIQDASINRKFPNTLEVNITERTITAVVEVPANEKNKSLSLSTSSINENTKVRNWAISSDRVWLMPIPEKNSDVAKQISQQIYEDLNGVLHIVDVLPSVNPEIGYKCTDDSINNATDVVSSMTTDLKNQVKYIRASDTQSSSFILNNGVEVSIGTSDDMRNKERVVLELLDKHQGKISYINVRNAAKPTWRSM